MDRRAYESPLAVGTIALNPGYPTQSATLASELVIKQVEVGCAFAVQRIEVSGFIRSKLFKKQAEKTGRVEIAGSAVKVLDSIS
jgi:hypothetical protein